MKITKIKIKKFRGFQGVKFTLGSHLTVISGQNGTQKTTLLGMLTQPFTITDTNSPMYKEKPLSGGSFKSAFSDKFKLSHIFDKPREHEWELYFDEACDNEGNKIYTIESIPRDKKNIRFWKKGSKLEGSGYVQLPVIYLSLKRLLPIGEDNNLIENKSLKLTKEEKKFYEKWHNKILILTNDTDKITSATSLESPHKQTLGANTSYYDWQSNSAGQDNIGKILLAILSFKRLHEKYTTGYKGGILAIDEIDTTFYPGSQVQLLDALNKFASKYKIQIIFTTHSLTLLKEASKYHQDENRKKQIRLIYLKRKDKKIVIQDNVDYEYIENHLNVTLTNTSKKNKIDVFTEDPEGAIFAKSLLGSARTKYLKFHTKVKLGGSNLIELASKVPCFQLPNSIIILDGDVQQPNRVKKIKNILFLPTTESPEQIISKFLNNLPESEQLWKEIDKTFTKQYCFKYILNDDIQKDRKKAKEWFNSHKEVWGRNCNKVLNPWKKQNKTLVNEFLEKFKTLFEKF